MQMQRGIAVLVLAIGFLAAPLSGAAALDSCSPCCPQPADAPCETGDAPCVHLAAASCCDLAPVAPAPEAKRSTEAPSFHPLVTAVRSSAPVPRPVALARTGGDLALRTSPLRLSVVLLI